MVTHKETGEGNSSHTIKSVDETPPWSRQKKQKHGKKKRDMVIVHRKKEKEKKTLQKAGLKMV